MTKFKVDAVIEFDPKDTKGMCQIMDTYHSLGTSLYGTNESGEMTMMSIHKDEIIVETFQNNKWIRKNIYYRDGSSEEIVEGKWDF